MSHVKFLASDDSGGRGNATGLTREATYIAGQFQRAGLEPGGNDETYFQKFDADVPVDSSSSGSTVHTQLRNVVGLVRGSDPTLAAEAIVVGGHYDHLGRGGRFSNAPAATGEIHNGADDNASGTAAVIELCRAAATKRARLSRTLICAAFAGEEIGLLGSGEYIRRAPIPIDRTRAMINLDMVGRAHGRVLVGIFGGPSSMKDLRREMRAWTSLSVEDFTHGGYPPGSSDDDSFEKAGVPAIAFFTGFHSDYHRPEDDWQKIDAEGGARITTLALRLVEKLARGPWHD